MRSNRVANGIMYNNEYDTDLIGVINNTENKDIVEKADEISLTFYIDNIHESLQALSNFPNLRTLRMNLNHLDNIDIDLREYSCMGQLQVIQLIGNDSIRLYGLEALRSLRIMMVDGLISMKLPTNVWSQIQVITGLRVTSDDIISPTISCLNSMESAPMNLGELINLRSLAVPWLDREQVRIISENLVNLEDLIYGSIESHLDLIKNLPRLINVEIGCRDELLGSELKYLESMKDLGALYLRRPVDDLIELPDVFHSIINLDMSIGTIDRIPESILGIEHLKVRGITPEAFRRIPNHILRSSTVSLYPRVLEDDRMVEHYEEIIERLRGLNKRMYEKILKEFRCSLSNMIDRIID